MANHGGGVGSKFVSVNLNKSYGQSFHNHHHDINKSYSGSVAVGAGRGRGGGGGGGSGGGMVVLSRHNRSVQKIGAKLSVPPPLNLPSLRKEHERFDVSGSGSGVAGGGSGGQGSGPRPSSSGMGWTKPATAVVALQEKDGSSGTDGQVVDGLDHTGLGTTDGVSRDSGSYMPPSARGGGIGAAVTGPARAFPSTVEKVSVLRGEDFPSLRAALPAPSGPANKQKDGLSQKQKQVAGGEGSSDEQRDSYNVNLVVDMRPHGHSSGHATGNGLVENGYESHGLNSARRMDQPRKQEDFFPGPLPLVRLNPRSDWADDERDTGHGFADRGRDIGISKVDHYWDSDFDLPRTTVLPHKAAHNQYERRVPKETQTGNGFSTDAQRGDNYSRDLRIPSREGREGSTWRNSILPRDGNVPDVANNRNVVSSVGTAVNKDFGKDNKYVPPQFGDTSRDGAFTGNRDYSYGKKDMGLVTEGRQRWNHATESSNSRGAERMTQDRSGNELSNRYRRDGFQNNSGSKPSFVSVGKSPPMIDPILNAGREKRAVSRGERPYVEDPFSGSAGFDERDLFSGGLAGVIKRKKDVVKQTDFYDPVRESFEAELERVQKMQELERQRVMEEQERALEQARREEEERQRLIREEEERRRKVEEEAREAAWRAEQERLDAVRKAEELRIAREEEKRRLFLEEERRKQAAKQKLLELEAKIAKRRAEEAKIDTPAITGDEKISAMNKEYDVSGAADVDNWDESERMVERLTTSGSFDTPVLSRSADVSSQHYSSRESLPNFPDRGRPLNSWRGDAFEKASSSSMYLHDQDIGHHSPRRDASVGGRAAPRKGFSPGAGYLASGSYAKGGGEGYADDFGQRNRWNHSTDADPYIRNREMDTEFQDNLADRYGDISWGPAGSRGNTRFPYPDRLYQNSEADEPYSYGKSRYSVRQPRVLPPPSLSTMQRTFKGMNDHPGSSNLVDSETRYPHPRGGESTRQTGFFGGHPSELVAPQPESALAEDTKLNKNMSPRCDSQSSLSVTSPPNSPPHLSNDELDESGDSPTVSVAAEGKSVSLSGYECTFLNDNAKDAMKTASSSLSGIEDDDWNVEDNRELQQQEEYDEDDDGYREEDEVREADEENLDLNQELEDLQLGEGEPCHIMNNLVLGFDEGVEVTIPSDDFERNSRNEESLFDRPETSEGGSVIGVQVDEKCHHPDERLPGASLDSSSNRVQEAGKMMQESEFRLNTEHHTAAASNLLDGNDAYNGPSLCAQQTFSSVGTPFSVGQTCVSNLTSSTQPDLPVKLQFGLFTGPSLIPSPVPAIQIGSIQMPLHLHPPVGPSLTHIHPSQPPIFQFGQLRYSSAVSQGILPITAQSMSFGQPNVQAHYNTNQNSGGSVPRQPAMDASTPSLMKGNVQSLSANSEHGLSMRPGGPHDSKPAQESTERKALPANIAVTAGASDRKLISESAIQVEAMGLNADRHVQPSSEKGSGVKLPAVLPSIQSVSIEKSSAGGRAHGQTYGNKGKRYTYAVKGSGLRSSFPTPDGPYSESSRFQRRPRRTVQRTEFRIRENSDSRQSSSAAFPNDSGLGDRLNHNGRAAAAVLAKSGSKRGSLSSKILKQNVELDSMSGNVASQEVDYGNKASKDDRKAAPHKSQNVSYSGEGNLKRNISEEDVDAPLQSGVVRVFKQPGIEAPSDEDDFIEVRSKRQMLNDRREQREKEIKAKSRVSKPPRKPRTTRQSSSISTSPNKIYASVGGEVPKKSSYSNFVSSEAQGSAFKDVSTGSTTVSQPLAPIGTPAGSNGSQTEKKFHTVKSLQTTSGGGVSAGGNDLEPGLLFESKKNAENVTSSPLNSWGSAQINQQVMALSQSQLEEAMNPARFEASVGAHGCAVSEPILPSSSILTKDKSFSSVASPINSLLAGEKIQFGAVTSPTVLPTSSRVVSHGIGAPGSNRSEVQISRNISPDGSDCTLFFEKDKRANDPCVNVQDCESEAEAAASAVAVAAISSDEIAGSGLGSAISETKSFEGDQQVGSQSRAEESLSVSLPADLNVETPPISLWPALPSPQNASNQILTHFPGGAPSHFPFYEMNPVLGGPIFAFGPHKESGGAQSQSQKATVSSSGPLGAWQQCHSTLDSFYGHPAGFTGPFISPPGGIPGVQGPPHMVVYNHFAPVGQYGQVGLSFMGTTYLPPGKQPDWKHTPSSSAMGITEGDMNNVNMAGSQRNLSNMPATVQHLGPASPIMPIASPLAMFDVSPFQSSPEMPVQARWSHVPASPLHSVPMAHPLHQQAEGTLPSKFGHGHSVDQSSNTNRFLESRPSEASDGTSSFPVAPAANAAQFPDELGVVDSSKSGVTGGSAQTLVGQSSSGRVNADIGKNDALRNGIKDQGASGFKTQSQQKNASAQQNQPASYNYHRGSGMSQRNMSGNDWSHRRMGFHVRNQSLGAEKGFPSTKVKQIYVAKQTVSGTKTTG